MTTTTLIFNTELFDDVSLEGFKVFLESITGSSIVQELTDGYSVILNLENTEPEADEEFVASGVSLALSLYSTVMTDRPGNSVVCFVNGKMYTALTSDPAPCDFPDCECNVP